MLLVKAFLIIYAYKKGWDLKKFLLIVTGYVLGSALGAILLPSIMGAIIGGVLTVFILKRLLLFRPQLGAIYAVFIAGCIGMGRFGCLLNGCCFGTTTSLPWGVTYAITAPAHWLHYFTGQIGHSHHSLPVHPVQLYESIFLFLSVFIIFKITPRLHNKNSVLPGFMGAYLLFRFAIEFIRDMTNIWWGLIYLGPVSMFQLFLLITSAGGITLAIILEKRYKPLKQTLNLPAPISTRLLLPAFFCLTTLIIHKQIVNIFLIQLIIFLPVCTFILLKDLIPVYHMRVPIAYGGCSLALLLLLSPMMMKVYAESYNTNPLNGKGVLHTGPKTKTWFYEIDRSNNKLVKMADQNTSFYDFKRKRLLLKMDNAGGESDSIIFNEVVKQQMVQTINYYGAFGAGHYKYEVGGCNGPITYYNYKYMGTTGGYEIHNSKANSYTNYYYGIRGSYYADQWTSRTEEDSVITGTNHGMHQTLSFHGYGNADYKWAGIGGGFSMLAGSGYEPDAFPNMPFIYPNLYLRLGHPWFHIEAGVSDRYMIRPVPIYGHLNFGIRTKDFALKLGITNIGNLPAMFSTFSFNTPSGYTVEPSLMITDGIGLNLKNNRPLPYTGN